MLRTFRHCRALLLRCFALALGFVSAGLSHASAEEVTVLVKSGRRFTAEVDARSDASKLWLRFSKETSAILRPIEWSAITEIRRDGQLLPIDKVRAEAIEAHAALPKPPQLKPAPRAVEQPSRGEKVPRGSFGSADVRPAAGVALASDSAREPVRSISVDAHLANWDADVEPDGLFLSVAAFDGNGLAAAVDATLEVELIGPRLPPYSRGNAFPQIARWTRQVTAADIEASGGYYRTRLEFQALHPEYQLWLANHALVHVRLLVPGDGAFEASIDGVPLRSFSPVRERAQQAFGTRFLPNEQSGRGRRESSTFGN